MDNKKYILFDSCHAGLCNVLMSYEIALAISSITNRTLIIPPNSFCWAISQDRFNKNKWTDIWQVIDYNKVKENFDVVLFNEVEEIKEIKFLLETHSSYIGNISNSNLNFYKFFNPNFPLLDDHYCMVNNLNNYINSKDFKNFVSDRPILDLDREEKYLVFDSCLFGHFWYMVYPGNADKRNNLKDKINKSLYYKKKYFDLVEDTIKPFIGDYNAVHIRRNDFCNDRSNEIKNVDSELKILQALKQLFPTNLPLYISTDETNKDFFTLVGQEYKIYFYDSFMFKENLNNLEMTIIEQIICSNANIFYGTYYSTFTKRINIMRGLNNKQADDEMGINNITFSKKQETTFPWITKPDKKWVWHDSSYWQWTKE